MKHLKKFEGFLFDNSGKIDMFGTLIEPNTETLALELIDPLLEPIRDHYELDFSGLAHNKLQLYFGFRPIDTDELEVIVDEKLLKLLRALSAKLKDYGLKVLIENKSLFKLVSGADIDVDKLSKEKTYKTGYLLIRDEKYTEPKATRSTGPR